MWDAATWQKLLDGFVLFLPRLLTGLIVFVVLWLIAKGAQRVVRRLAALRNLDPNLTAFLSGTAKVVLMFVGAVMALGTMGVDVTALVAGLGLTGFAVGFALKDIISNALSGILILVYKPFRHGDHITVEEHEGQVIEINLRYTVLDVEDKTIFVPNANLFTNVVSVKKKDTPPPPINGK
ncbi:MAG TPA: mechanosensitive ion channel domain-containing protein [Gemmataceae bacterium]|nr:mechanosensitive ion channel domain-containing protein [Gemmataceae bacterium]